MRAVGAVLLTLESKPFHESRALRFSAQPGLCIKASCRYCYQTYEKNCEGQICIFAKAVRDKFHHICQSYVKNQSSCWILHMMSSHRPGIKFPTNIMSCISENALYAIHATSIAGLSVLTERDPSSAALPEVSSPLSFLWSSPYSSWES